MSRAYYCELPCYGTQPVVRLVKAPNKRAAAREASRAHDAYWNRDRMPGHRVQRTPAAHWNVRGMHTEVEA